MQKRIPHILLFLYCVVFILTSISPYNRAYWIITAMVPAIIVFVLVKTYSSFRFSNTAYILVSLFLFVHTIGGYYFHHRVPFDFVTEFFGFQRHNFDRLGHISVGFYAFLVAEFLLRKKLIKAKWLIYAIAFCFIMTIAALYEIIEWLYVLVVSPESDSNFVGAQGDIWDAQKDMVCDGIGALFALLVFKIKSKNILPERTNSDLSTEQ